jgi:DNA-binding response OmpR family regulator
MNPPKILLIDPDPKNVRILRNNFLDLHFEVDAAGNDAEAVEKLNAHLFDAILTEVSAPGIDGYAVLEQALQSSLNRSSAIIFLTQKSDVWNRVKSFKLGAKDYIIKPIHVREIVGRVQMILKRRERNKRLFKRSRSQFCGRLADLKATELIEVFGAERKSGILSLFNENGVSGQMVFKHGAVIQATVGRQRGEEAVLKMLSWSQGRFSMVFASVEGNDEIGVSNMGLLLQGAKRMEQREELLQHLPALETVLVTTQNFKKIIAKKELASDLEYFVSLFDGVRSLGRIIDESKYDEITTLQRILKLYQLGFLHVLREFGTGRAPAPEKRIAEPQEAAARFSPETEGDLNRKPAPEPRLVPDLERVERALGAASAEDLLHEEIGAEIPQEAEDAQLPAQESWPVPEPPIQPEEQLSAVQPPLSGWDTDSSYDKDLFYDLRRAEEEGQDLFGGQKGEEGGLVFPDLERVIPQHPADALLRLTVEEEMADIAPPEERSDRSAAPVEQPEPPPFTSHPRPSIPIVTEDESGEVRGDLRELERDLRLQEKFRRAHGSILILGNNRELCRQMIVNLSSNQVQEKGAFQPNDSDILLGTAEFKGGHLLNLIALSLELEFAPVIDYFAGSLLGFILLIDGRNVDWGYQRYLRQVLREKTSLPAVVVFSYNEYLQNPLEMATIRQRLGLRERDGLQLVSDFSVVNSRRIVFRLFEMFYRPKSRQNRPAGTMQPSSLK